MGGLLDSVGRSSHGRARDPLSPLPRSTRLGKRDLRPRSRELSPRSPLPSRGPGGGKLPHVGPSTPRGAPLRAPLGELQLLLAPEVDLYRARGRGAEALRDAPSRIPRIPRARPRRLLFLRLRLVLAPREPDVGELRGRFPEARAPEGARNVGLRRDAPAPRRFVGHGLALDTGSERGVGRARNRGSEDAFSGYRPAAGGAGNRAAAAAPRRHRGPGAPSGNRPPPFPSSRGRGRDTPLQPQGHRLASWRAFAAGGDRERRRARPRRSRRALSNARARARRRHLPRPPSGHGPRLGRRGPRGKTEVDSPGTTGR